MRPQTRLDGDNFLGLEEDLPGILASPLTPAAWLPDRWRLLLYNRPSGQSHAPARNTLLLLEACPGHSTNRTEHAAQLYWRPLHRLHPRAGDSWVTSPGGPGAVSWDGAGTWLEAGLRVGLQSTVLPAPLQDCETHLAPPT